MGWTFALSFLPIDATAHELQTRTASPLQMAIAWLTDWTVALTFALFALLAFFFPTGRLAQGGWRRFASIVLVLIWGSVIVSAFWPVLTVVPNDGVDIVEIPNPVGFLPRSILGVDLASQSMGIAVLPLILVASIAASGSLCRRAGPGTPAAALARGGVRGDRCRHPRRSVVVAVFDAGGEVAWVPASVAFMLPPIAIGIAVTRYRLYEIDRLVGRGLSWALLTGVLLAVFAGAVLLLQPFSVT